MLLHFFGRTSGEERIDEVREDVVMEDGRVFARVTGRASEFREGSLDDFAREFLGIEGSEIASEVGVIERFHFVPLLANGACDEGEVIALLLELEPERVLDLFLVFRFRVGHVVRVGDGRVRRVNGVFDLAEDGDLPFEGNRRQFLVVDRSLLIFLGTLENRSLFFLFIVFRGQDDLVCQELQAVLRELLGVPGTEFALVDAEGGNGLRVRDLEGIDFVLEQTDARGLGTLHDDLRFGNPFFLANLKELFQIHSNLPPLPPTVISFTRMVG